MKIIDIAICVDNLDPKGIGRIRCIRYNDYVGEKEKAFNYQDWDDLDPFVATPFLPSNINYIPEIGQSVKVINYNTDKETVNQEYIAGPFTTLYDFNGQSFSQQIENTSYGVAVKRKASIRKSTGDYIEKNTEYVFAKEKHYGLYGKYGSDLLFTENGALLRGGKLLSKEAASVKNKKKLITTPIYSEKISKLQLKKYPKKANIIEESVQSEVYDTSILNSIIEYEIDSLTNPTKINFFVYQVTNPIGDLYTTANFDEKSPLILGDTTTNPPLRLVNTDGSLTGATHTININLDEDENLENYIYIQIRDTINTISQKTLFSINSLYTSEDLHPIYFRPSENFYELTGTTIQQEFKNNILNNVNIKRVGPGYGLIWSLSSATQKPKILNTVKEVFNIDENSDEQTFASLSSDKIFLISTDTNETEKKINYEALNKYEYTQENYIKDIEPNTYSMVRGEELIEVLKVMRDLFESHIHNITTPLIKSDPNFIKLEEKINNLENIILNKSIRIN